MSDNSISQIPHTVSCSVEGKVIKIRQRIFNQTINKSLDTENKLVQDALVSLGWRKCKEIDMRDKINEIEQERAALEILRRVWQPHTQSNVDRMSEQDIAKEIAEEMYRSQANEAVDGSVLAEPVLRIYVGGGMATVTKWLDGARNLSAGDYTLYAAPVVHELLKDHQIRELVNQVTVIALEHHASQSLRERISQAIVPCLQQRNLTPQDKQDALRWRTISNLFNQCTTSRSERILEALTLDPERACEPLEDIIDAVLYTNPKGESK